MAEEYDVPREDFRVTLARRALAQSKAGEGETAERWARCENALELVLWFVDERLEVDGADRLGRIENRLEDISAGVGRIEDIHAQELATLAGALEEPHPDGSRLLRIEQSVDEIRRVLVAAATGEQIDRQP